MESRISELLEALDGLDIDGDLLAEALWLSKHMSDQRAETAPGPRPPPDDELDPVPPWSPPAADSVALTPRDPAAAMLSGYAGSWPDSGEVAVPAPSPLDSGERLRGELRPLARRFADPHQRVFDEEASVELTARTGVAWPVTRPELIRQRDAALVFDRHPSMAAWSGLAAAVRTVVESVGFRRVETWYLDEDDDGTLGVATDPLAPTDRPLSELRDPSGRRVIMVFSACLGNAWGWGTAARQLAEIATGSPVTIVQPLPNSLWGRTGLHWGRGRITPMIADCPSPLRVLGSTGSGMIPIPVLELTPGWIAPWARLLAGYRRTAGYPLLRLPAANPDRTRTLATQQDATLGQRPLERVRRFRSASSPEAFRLAASLAQVPLRLPIMRLVQQAVLPGTAPSVLAEVLAGGLIEDATAGAPPPYTIAEENRAFVFRPGVEEILRDAIPRSEATRVLAEVSRFIAERYGVPGAVFPATLSEPDGSGGSSFAYLSPETLRRVSANFPEPQRDPPSADDEQRFAELAREAFAAEERGDADEALLYSRRALAAVPVGHPLRGGLLRTVTSLLTQRWERTREVSDLDEAIAVAKLALKEMPEDDSELAGFATQLGELLLQRYSAAGGVDYLTDGTRVLRGALAVTGSGHPSRARIAERLGDAYLLRCEAAGEPLHGWDAVDLYLEAGQAEASADRAAVLMLKIARAYLDIAEVSAYPEEGLDDHVIEQLRYAAPRMADREAEETYAALRDVVERVARTVTGGAMPSAVAERISSILGSVTGWQQVATLVEARRDLDAVAAVSGVE